MNTRPLCVWLSCSFLILAGGAVCTADKPVRAPDKVPVAQPIAQEVIDHEDFTGRTEAVTRVDLRTRVTGYLFKATFQEGDEVKEGATLFEIDPRPYRAELDKAEANLNMAKARLKRVELDHQRALRIGAGAISKEELDKIAADRDEAGAAVVAAEAARDAGRINLDYTRIVAPVGGRVGRRLVDPGNLVVADKDLLATIVSQGPLHAYFDIDERTTLRLRRALREGKRATEKLPVAIGLADEEGYPHRAVLDFVDNRINPETGTLRMRAVLANKDGLLVPGLFVRVRLAMGGPYKALLVPGKAVLVEDRARFVFVVNDKDVLEKRPVEVGQEHDGLRVVTKGLKPDDRVVVGRLTGLRPGMVVEPVVSETPTPPPPRPSDKPPSGAPAAVLGRPGPVVLVEATYPGANAQVVADTVAAPIEQQVNGAEDMLYMRSRCSNDGKYLLAVTFRRGADPKLSQVLVQNRVSLATPVLPSVVDQSGITVRQRGPAVLLIANLCSPDNSRDSLYLSNYANIEIKDELLRLPGVGDVTLIGQRDYVLRVWLDPDRLAAYGLSAAEVARAIEKENVKGDGRLGRPPADKEEGGPALVIRGRRVDPEKLANLVVKTAGEGSVVHLKDVARLELGAGGAQSHAFRDGRPVVALAIQATREARPEEVAAAVRARLSKLCSKTPAGLGIGVFLNFTKDLEASDRPTTVAPLLIDLELPVAASTQRTLEALEHCDERLRRLPGVQDVLALSEGPFDLFGSGPCLLVLLASGDKSKLDREAVVGQVRKELAALPEIKARVRDLPTTGGFPRWGYPIAVAVQGPEADRVREMARKLAQRLSGSNKLTDVSADNASRPRPQLTVDVDRAMLAERGVSAEDVFTTLEVVEGALHVNDFNRFGRTWRVEVQTRGGSGDLAKDIRKLKVRNARGEMVPLNNLVKVRETEAPLALDLLDRRPMVEITANPAVGASPADVRALVEGLADEVRKELRLPAEYGLTWTQEWSRSK